MRSKFGYLFIALIILIADQWTKHWAMTSLQPVGVIEIIEGFFRFTYATNRGVAFSLFADSAMDVKLIFATISSVAALFVSYYLFKTPSGKKLTNASLALLLSGIIGNLIDRVRFGEVIDFLDFHLRESYTWPTFNVADASICIGAVLLALDMLRDERAARSKAQEIPSPLKSPAQVLRIEDKTTRQFKTDPVNSCSPELFRISYLNFTFNTYGFLLALAFVVGLLTAAKLGERDGLGKQKVYDLGLWVLAASLVGSKLLMVITEWDLYYRDNPRQIFTLDFFRSGGVFYGGFIGAVIASIIVMRIYKLPWWRTADAFAPGIAIGQAIGRLGCFSAGCCWGKPTTAFCGVHFTDRGHEVTGVPTIVGHLSDPIQQNYWAEKLGGLPAPLHLHPTQLYEAGATLLIFIALLIIYKRRKFHGQVILIYALLYAITRFIIEFVRDDPRGELFGLSTSQFIALLMFAGSAIGLFWRIKRIEAAK